MDTELTNLEDSLDDIFAGLESTDLRAGMARPAFNAKRDRWQMEGPELHKENCEKCRGSGRFVSWAWRDVGPCLACKGKGFKMFKTSAESRRIGREKAAAKAVAERQAWIDEHKAEFEWLTAKAAEPVRSDRPWTFPTDMLEAVSKWKGLTDNQLAAVRKCMVKDAERKAERAKAKAEREANAKTVDIFKIEAAFEAARKHARNDGEGIKWLRLNLGDFTFSDAPASGQFEACIFVKAGSINLGRIVKSKFHRFAACDDATEAKVIEAASDPFAAAKAFGQRTGTCCCCGRELTNENSRREGIGPVCATKHGWGA